MSNNNHVPPYSNTGVGHTLESGMRACLDWVQATLFEENLKFVIVDILGLHPDNFQSTKKGRFGYKKGLMFGNISIFYDGETRNKEGEIVDMGIHICFTGQGCRQYEAYGIKTWNDLFLDILEFKGHFSRIDVAIDEFNDLSFSIATLLKKANDGLIISKFKEYDAREKKKLKNGEGKGKSIYFGSPTSEIMFRFYQKDKQLEALGKKLEEGITAWNRYEVQLKNGKADAVARLICLGDDGQTALQAVVKGILSKYMRVIQATGDSNRHRRPTAKFWDKFIGAAEKLSLSQVAPDKTIDSQKEWLMYQAGPALAAIVKAEDGDMDFVYELLKSGESRLKDNHKNMIELHQLKKKEPEHPKVKIDEEEKEKSRIAEEEKAVREEAILEQKRLIKFLNGI